MTSNSRRNPRPALANLGNQGFTLIEILISITLLVVISISIYQSTTQTYRYRDVLVREGDFYNSIRLSMGMMERDVALLFSPVSMNPNQKSPLTASQPGDSDPFAPGANDPLPVPQQPDAAYEQLMQSELAQVSDHWLPVTDKSASRASRFVGEAQKLTFISSSHQRLYKNYPESEFAKIAYELRDDRSEDAMEGTKILFKIEDPNAFDDIEKREKTAKAYPILPGVKSLKFRFYRKDKKVWETKWDNSKDDQKDLYPDLVEISLEVSAAGRQNFSGTYIFKPEMPFYGLDPTL